jgi:predicted RNase H-like nuclease (RuvC/YqgF family)
MGTEPTPEAEAGAAGLEPRRGQGLDAVAYLPRLVISALQDLRSMAEATRVLPSIAEATRVLPVIAEATRELPAVARSLSSIEARVETLDREVVEMHQAVESIREEMDDFRAEVHGTMHPLSRATARVRRLRGGGNGK